MRILGIDFGDSRTGFAISDPLGFGVTTLPLLHEKNMRKTADYAAALAKEKQAEKIVLGLPKNMDGSVGFRGERTREFAALLAERVSMEVIFWDERLTTVSAQHLMNETDVRGKKRKARLDSVSAAYILQSYLDSLK
ncbi:Holliday junction resolvase RuvX [Ructibacterium gallinarum]|uniref:Putative pre-16S rRNA nuclease n=1 Tax=Ructibacterium gallinarum TaxID=2779355 RepID=A0A9D5LZ89_9FIRM|nr:Holliday junction resolvase RuvX [Ructibacterium gallinarum]MBE5039231.1 Holliday junction resolvase RuvX [Ructibacterium gallinarum]